MNKTVLGSGAYNLDTIVVRDYPLGPEKKKFVEREITTEVGGTCGNVMSMLPYLGIQTFPQVKLDRSEQSFRIKDDLRRYGADTRFVTNEEKGGLFMLRCTHKTTPEGEHRMTPRQSGPNNSLYGKRTFLGALNGEAEAFADSLDFVPDVYFFDEPAAGHVVIARKLREKGTMVYFEPEKIADGKMKPFLSRVDVSDIVKFSGERISDVSWTDGYADKLFIQTRGSEGLRFRLRGGKWIGIAPVHNDNVVDWEGAGDWTTSAFIAYLLGKGWTDIRTVSEDQVKEALEEASRVASRSVSFLGSKGMISESKTE